MHNKALRVCGWFLANLAVVTIIYQVQTQEHLYRDCKIGLFTTCLTHDHSLQEPINRRDWHKHTKEDRCLFLFKELLHKGRRKRHHRLLLSVTHTPYFLVHKKDSIMKGITFLSFNAKGLQTDGKRKKVFNWLRKKK